MAPEAEPDAADAAPDTVPPAPVVWLVGKVQSGKSSIVQAITGSDAAAVGSGFRACTTTAKVYDYPQEASVLRFLDTRGLGEAGYDPAEDLAFAEAQSHLLLVVTRAMDHAQETVLDALAKVRARRPELPMVVAQTCLHEGYARHQDHTLPYPFGDGEISTISNLPSDLLRSLAHQRRLIEGLPGTGNVNFVPIDFTQDGDGYEPRLYGLDALKSALAMAAPLSLAAALGAIANGSADMRAARAHPHIMGYALTAGAADALPVAGAVAVPGIQAKLLHSIGRIYGIEWDRQTLVEFGGCLGSSVVTRLAASFGIRQVVKLVPVYGQTIGAAAAAATSFATTYALGKAACFFLNRRQNGQVDAGDVARTYAQSLEAAF